MAHTTWLIKIRKHLGSNGFFSSEALLGVTTLTFNEKTQHSTFLSNFECFNLHPISGPHPDGYSGNSLQRVLT